MERLMKVFNKEFSKIGEAAVVLAFFTLLSQFLGIFRDRYLAGNIGTGEILDIYYAAFRVPDLLFTLGASLVSVSILMPYFTKQLQHSQEKARLFINNIFTVFFIFMTVLSIIAFILMPYFSKILFSGLAADAISEITLLSRVMLLSPILLGISNLYATITQAFKKFFVYALAPVFYNIGIILGIVVFYPLFGILGLAYGVVLGALLHMLIQLPVVARQGFLPKFSFSIVWENISEVIKHSLPRTITLSLSKIVFLIFVGIASTLVAGTISIFNLSYNLQSVPLAIIGVSYSVAAFPILVDYFNSKNYQEFMAHVMGPIRQIVFWSLPVISLFVVLRAQIVRVVLGTGNFDWSDTRLTAASLALFIISVVAQSIVLLLIRAYYASGKTWKPLWITLVSSAVTVIFAYLFLYLFSAFTEIQKFFEVLLRIEGVEGSSVIMLSLAFSMGMFLNLYLLWASFKRDFEYKPGLYGIRKSFFQSLVASFIMGVSTYIMLNVSSSIFSSETTLGVLGHGFISGIFGIVLGVLFLVTIKNNETLVFVQLIKKSLWNTKTVGTIHGDM